MVAHLPFFQTHKAKQKTAKELPTNAQRHDNGQTNNDRERRANA